MRRLRERVAGSAVALSAGILWLALPDVPRVPDACSQPREVAARGGHSTDVSCAPVAGSGPVRGPARLLFGRKLDLNCADVAALQVLPAIGPTRAAAIVETRREHAFGSLEDLRRVPGIGPRTVEQLSAWAGVFAPPAGQALCRRVLERG